MMAMVLDVGGKGCFTLSEAAWKCITPLIHASEALPPGDWGRLEEHKGFRLSAEQGREIARFIGMFLEKADASGAYGLPSAGQSAGAAVAVAPRITRERLEAFARFCEEARQGLALW